MSDESGEDSGDESIIEVFSSSETELESDLDRNTGQNRSLRKTPANRKTTLAAQRTPATNGRAAGRREATHRKTPTAQKTLGTVGRKSRKGLANIQMTPSIALWHSSLFIDGQWKPSSLDHSHPIPLMAQHCPLPTQTSMAFSIWMRLFPCFGPLTVLCSQNQIPVMYCGS